MGQKETLNQREESGRVSRRWWHIRKALTQTWQQKEAKAISHREARLRKAKERNVRARLLGSRSPLWESACEVHGQTVGEANGSLYMGLPLSFSVSVLALLQLAPLAPLKQVHTCTLLLLLLHA